MCETAHRGLPARTSVQVRGPASVLKVKLLPSGASDLRAIQAATQRVPLPLISAMPPSALRRRMMPARSPVHSRNSTPSAPTPVVRAQSAMASARSASSLRGAAFDLISTTRKSLPQACAFAYSIIVLVSPSNQTSCGSPVQANTRGAPYLDCEKWEPQVLLPAPRLCLRARAPTLKSGDGQSPRTRGHRAGPSYR